MDITVIRQYRKKDNSESNVYVYNSDIQGQGSGSSSYSPIPPAIISFAATQYPSILNYQINYATSYGAYPKVLLFTFDENNDMLERADKPKRVILNDVLDSIVWDLGYEDSGIIILYPTL